MSSYSTTWTVPVPVAAIVPAAVHAAGMVGLRVQSQMPYSMKCKGGMTFSTYPVTVEVSVAGVDGAAAVLVYAHNFGLGPLQSGACEKRATALLQAMSNILQGWAQQNAAPTPPQPAGPTY
jgi:hypothetical protein